MLAPPWELNIPRPLKLLDLGPKLVMAVTPMFGDFGDKVSDLTNDTAIIQLIATYHAIHWHISPSDLRVRALDSARDPVGLGDRRRLEGPRWPDAGTPQQRLHATVELAAELAATPRRQLVDAQQVHTPEQPDDLSHHMCVTAARAQACAPPSLVHSTCLTLLLLSTTMLPPSPPAHPPGARPILTPQTPSQPHSPSFPLTTNRHPPNMQICARTPHSLVPDLESTTLHGNRQLFRRIVLAGKAIKKWMAKDEAQQTLVHGDAHRSNFAVFRPPPAAPGKQPGPLRAMMIDFQYTSRGPAGLDVAFFLLGRDAPGHGFVTMSHAHENELLTRYHEALVAGLRFRNLAPPTLEALRTAVNFGYLVHLSTMLSSRRPAVGAAITKWNNHSVLERGPRQVLDLLDGGRAHRTEAEYEADLARLFPQP